MSAPAFSPSCVPASRRTSPVSSTSAASGLAPGRSRPTALSQPTPRASTSCGCEGAIGVHSSALRGKSKAAGITPTTVCGVPSTLMLRPTRLASAP